MCSGERERYREREREGERERERESASRRRGELNRDRMSLTSNAHCDTLTPFCLLINRSPMQPVHLMTGNWQTLNGIKRGTWAWAFFHTAGTVLY